MAQFICDLSQSSTHFPHFWEHGVGSGRASLALRADWQAQLRKCHAELGFQYVRFHGLLSDDMGTLVYQNEQWIYSFFNADQIIDFLLSIGMKPFIELSFMPEALASGTKTVFKYRGNVTPPKDYGQWAALIRKLVRHWLDRYGISEVSRWFFEVWNEPNLEHFWTGSQEDYFRLYRSTMEAIKGIDPALRVGGPATAQNDWIDAMIGYCEREHIPLDFITTHYYPTDAFGDTQTDTESQLANAPPEVMHDRARSANHQAAGRPLYYTEWNITSNPRDPLHDQPFAAAYAIKILMSVVGLVDGYSYWTFSDIFEENYFPSVPFHGGFGLLNLHSIPKPVYRAFELLHRLGDRLIAVEGPHDTVRVWAIRNEERLTILLINHALPRHAIQTERVNIRLLNSPVPTQAWIERIDHEHANPRQVWLNMGQPTYLTEGEVDRLCTFSQMVAERIDYVHNDKVTTFDLSLPPHGVAAATLIFNKDESVEPEELARHGG
ncbi:MAG: beta-xylosidase [Chloroflexota bacterium]|nr:MAG: beta-xylosidase [Chloroflexota bacterium]